MNENCPEFLSVKEVAQLLQVSLNTAYACIRICQIRIIRIGRQIRIPKSAVDALSLGKNS